MSRGNDRFYPWDSSKILAGLIAGGISIIDSQDLRVTNKRGEGFESGAVGGAAEGGEVGQVAGELMAEHAVPLAFNEDEGWMSGPVIGAEEGLLAATDIDELWLKSF